MNFKPQLESMKVYVRRHAAVKLLEKLDNERDILIDAVRGVIKALRHVELPSIQPHVEALAALFANHQANTISTDTRTSETERILMLQRAIEADVKLQKAIATLAMRDIMERLGAVNGEYHELFSKHIADVSNEEKMDTATFRKECSVAVEEFFSALEFCALEYEDVDYTPIFNELNSLNSYYIAQLKARATRNKNRNKNDEEQEDDTIVPPAE